MSVIFLTNTEEDIAGYGCHLAKKSFAKLIRQAFSSERCEYSSQILKQRIKDWRTANSAWKKIHGITGMTDTDPISLEKIHGITGMTDTVPIPKELTKRGITSVEDNLGPDQSLDCGHLLFVHFEEEFKKQFFDKKEAK